jgi:hypothetical protein
MMTEEELRKQALGLAAAWIRANVSAGVIAALDDLPVPDQHKLERMLEQLAGELDEEADRKRRPRRQARPVEVKPFWLSVTRIDGGDNTERRYKRFRSAQVSAVRLLERENADREHRNPAQRVWIYEGDGKDAQLRECYGLDSDGAVVIDHETQRTLGLERRG